ncbi:MAG: hypothetical protein ABF913_04920 [Oenococcus sp.]|uniref:hypothetical protein n=1 Tax=Oenococcus sp. TaxID=1979414 RepID=UPI0039E7E042
MSSDYGPYNMLDATKATHEFLHKQGQVTPQDRAFLYQIKHARVGKIIKWQWKDIQKFIEDHKTDELSDAV